MNGPSVYLFGQMEVVFPDGRVASFRSSKAKLLLAYLLLHRRPHHREALASLFWPESTTAQSRKALRQTLWQLRTALGDESKEYPLLQVDAEKVGIEPKAEFWLDVNDFEQAYRSVRRVSGSELSAEQAQRLHEAARLYRGDLCEGCYEDWCLFEQERLRNIYLEMLDKLIDYCAGQSYYEEACECGATILRFDPARECTHRRLMRLHYLAGRRTAALRQYELCVRILDVELGVQPAESTRRLYEQIRSGRAPLPVWNRDEEGATSGAKPGFLSTVAAFQTLRQILGRLQEELLEEGASAIEGHLST
ncbi:MAG: hypothetical protein H5T69_06785 [Chloroflexi bacterium]|nr:hypothetical protein [Chloroflexota bacterium]